MGEWLKRTRGAVGVGLTWAVGWGFVGALIGPWLGDAGAIVGSSLTLAACGLLGGAGFSVALGLAGRRRAFDEMSLLRFAVLGASASLLMFMATLEFQGGVGIVFTPPGLPGAALWTLLGAGSAAGSLALARNASDGALIEPEESVGRIEER